jgi:hypothetical protein
MWHDALAKIRACMTGSATALKSKHVIAKAGGFRAAAAELIEQDKRRGGNGKCAIPWLH